MENREEQERQQALSTLNHKPIEDQLKDLESAVLSGWVSSLDAVMAAKKMQQMLDTLKKNINDSAMMEMDSFQNGYVSSLGKIEKRATATRYSYKHIDKWAQKKAELKEIEDAAKLASRSTTPLYDNEGAEIEQAHQSGGGETIFITLKK